ncbi:hypothetical protein O181_090730 [Austropuccinia psidii MF-1]|uniref:Uncharacterized protein n=1 Tax=Austropuccinia psidii MF-1 TaxID=1389203 RepID=A0A9Q3P7D3_9BASI|nr:hypothetical protein [Austropuccinia psidii MF-1]
MVSSHELGIVVESLSHGSNPDPPVLLESQPPSSQKPNFKSYEKDKTVKPCALTEDAGQDDVIFIGEVEIISEEQFISKIAQTIPRLEKIQNDSKIPDYVRQKIDEAMSLLKIDLKTKPPDNLPKSEHSFFKMVQSLLYPSNPVKHFWANFMFGSITLVSYNVIAPKPYVAPTSNLTDPLGLKQAAVEYLACCLSKSKQRETQLSIEGGGADNEISTKPYKNLEDLIDTVIHFMIAYNMVCAHTKVEVNGIKGKLTSLKRNEAIKDLFTCHKNLGINPISYGILAAFCAEGVCGLMVCSDDWKTSSFTGALSLIDISEKLSDSKNLVELVWLRTKKYIFSLLNKSFFSSECFNPTVRLRFEFL